MAIEGSTCSTSGYWELYGYVFCIEQKHDDPPTPIIKHNYDWLIVLQIYMSIFLLNFARVRCRSPTAHHLNCTIPTGISGPTGA